MADEQTPFDPDKSLGERLDINFALKAAGLGVWEVDPITQLVNWDDRCRELFGLAVANRLPYQQASQHIHPADRVRIEEAGRWAMNPQSGGGYDVTFRTLDVEDGVFRWVRFMGQAYFNEAGEVHRFAGVAQQVDNRYQRQQLSLLVENAPEFMATTDLDGRMQFINGYGLDLFGLTIDQVSGKLLTDFVPPDELDRVNTEVLPSVMQGGWSGTIVLMQPETKLRIPVWCDAYLLTDSTTGQPYGIAGIVRDRRPELATQQNLVESEARYRSIVEQTSAPILVLRGDQYLVDQINEPMIALMGQGNDVIGKPLLELMPELEGEFAWQQAQRVYQEGISFDGKEVLVTHATDGVMNDNYYNLAYRPLKEHGQITGMIQVVTNVTEQVKSRQKVEESEARLLSVIAAAPSAIGLLIGPDHILENPNQTFIDILGKGPGIAGKPLSEAMPELITENQPFLQILDEVYSTGQPFHTFDTPIDIVQHGVLIRGYYSFSYTPLFDKEGKVYAILDIATDVTERVLSRQRMEDSLRQVLAFFEQSPVGIAIISEDNLTFRMANPFYGYLVGRQPEELVGKSLLEALPELEGQGFDGLLREVIDTGVPFIANEVAVDIIRHDQLETIYVDLTYQPQYERRPDHDEEFIAGILVIATDVTQQVLARKKVEESEARFRSLIQEAPVATSLYVGKEMTIEVANEIILGYWGKDASVLGKPLAVALPELEGQPFLQLLDEIFNTGRTHHQQGARADLVVNGVLNTYYFDYTYKPLRDANGKIYAIMNMAIEVTKQVTAHRKLTESEERYRILSAELEEQVQQRTEELVAINEEMAATNEELASANEEYAALNEELEETNQLFSRSNQNLEQFAYIASHDLQEPLRKVQQFGDLLKNQYADRLGEGVHYLERMQSAASRMSRLIKDLLAFSRISTRQEVFRAVSLHEVVNAEINELDLRIQETGAVVDVGSLPTIQGDSSQLGQLFQNLLNNALKFRQETSTPRIALKSQLVSATELPASVKPTRAAQNYYRIDVIDNGIGFNEKYLDRIFQVFQRLHGKQEFAGTGIGLAICEKVATNHGGAISASSHPGQGATFSVYFPV